jgi:hypothetical protein
MEQLNNTPRAPYETIELVTGLRQAEQIAMATNSRSGPPPTSSTERDSAYGSIIRSSGTNATETPSGEPNQIQKSGRRVPGTDLFLFKMEGDKNTLRHCANVRSGVAALLRDAIEVAGHDPSCTGTRLAAIGKSAEEATLRLVVFCAPELQDTILNFFKSVHVVALLNPRRLNAPKLEHLVIPEAPRIRSARFDIDVCCPNVPGDSLKTHCGAPILLRSGQTKRQATFGGIVKVTHASGESILYGMTAGHLLEDFPVQSGPAIEEKNAQVVDTNLRDIDNWICKEHIVGQVIDPSEHPGIAAGSTKQTHDWALIDTNVPRPNEVANAMFNQPDVSNETAHQILVATRPSFQDQISDPVLLLSGTHGTLRGELSSLSASIWVRQGDGFVDAYMLELADGAGKTSNANLC